MQIADSDARSWVFRFRLGGRMREMGLGPLSRVSLGEARKLAARYRQMVRDKVDPIRVHREQQRQRLLETAADAVATFREAAEAFIRAREQNWKNPKHPISGEFGGRASRDCFVSTETGPLSRTCVEYLAG
jgi:hypothetical protein